MQKPSPITRTGSSTETVYQKNTSASNLPDFLQITQFCIYKGAADAKEEHVNMSEQLTDRIYRQQGKTKMKRVMHVVSQLGDERTSICVEVYYQWDRCFAFSSNNGYRRVFRELDAAG